MSHKAKRRAICFCVCLVYIFFFSDVGSASLRAGLESVLSDVRLEGARIALHVEHIEDGEVLYSKKSDLPFIPASNQKIVTAVAALDLLGPDYEFLTTLWMSGEITEGVLDGDLWLVGGGDPTLGSPAAGESPTAQFDRWARLLEGYGIRRIGGDVVIDQSFFDSEHVHPDWPDNQLMRHYSAPVSALIFQDNCVRLTVRPGAAPGRSALVEFSPPLGSISVENTCRTDPGSNAIWVDRTRDGAGIRVGGRAMYATGGWSGLVATPTPATFPAESFAQVLRSHNIEIKGDVREDNIKFHPGKEDMVLLARRRAPLNKVLNVMLVESQNLYAETVIKTIGARTDGRGSWESGKKEVSGAMAALGLDAGHLAVSDGSGYSRNNRITARAICKLLSRMYKMEVSPAFKTLLPVAGVEGTLVGRLTERGQAGRVHAKSGHIARVGALSGYARAKSGRLIVFSIMINDFVRGSNWDMRQIQDSIVGVILEAG